MDLGEHSIMALDFFDSSNFTQKKKINFDINLNPMITTIYLQHHVNPLTMILFHEQWRFHKKNFFIAKTQYDAQFTINSM